MSIAKLLVATVIAVAPIGVVSAQSRPPADSSSHAHEWLAGTGAAAGAGLFLALTHSGNHASASNSDFSFHAPTTPPPAQAGPTGGATPPTHTDSTSTPPDTNTVSTPPDTNTVTSPDKGDTTTVVTTDNSPGTDGPFTENDGPPPPTHDFQPFTAAASTVPEPGSAALLATGIIGLAPLLRKRRK
jgi:hypothetical protein